MIVPPRTQRLAIAVPWTIDGQPRRTKEGASPRASACSSRRTINRRTTARRIACEAPVLTMSTVFTSSRPTSKLPTLLMQRLACQACERAKGECEAHAGVDAAFEAGQRWAEREAKCVRDLGLTPV